MLLWTKEVRVHVEIHLEADKNLGRFPHHLWCRFDDCLVDRHFFAVLKNGNKDVKAVLLWSDVWATAQSARSQQRQSRKHSSWHYGAGSFFRASKQPVICFLSAVLVFSGLEFIFQNIGPDDDHLSSVVFILGAVLSLKQAKRLPCFPRLIQEDIRQAGVGFNGKVPANIIVGDGEPLH